jgi:hypothetical protein
VQAVLIGITRAPEDPNASGREEVRGSIIKRGAGYSIVFRVADPETGQSRQVWRSGFGTNREAERALHEIIGQLDAGTYVKPVNRPSISSSPRIGLGHAKVGITADLYQHVSKGLDQQAADRVANYILGDQ